jgi:hypothetical protein
LPPTPPTKPSNHKTNRIVKIVYNIFISFVKASFRLFIVYRTLSLTSNEGQDACR